MSQDPQKAAAIELKQAGRSFHGKPAVLPLDMGVAPGEFVSLLGPSGSGKSTLLKLIAGLDQPDAGSVTTQAFGRDFFKSFVFQDAALLPWRTVLQNTVLPLELMRVPRQEAKLRAEEALTKVGLADSLDLYSNQLSGGMKMRASIARALVAKPTLLLLDEPFAALDETTRFRLQEDLRHLWIESRMTTVFVTHSISEAVFLSNRALVFSSKPAKLLADVSIDLPVIRTNTLRDDERYLKKVREVASHFPRGESR